MISSDAMFSDSLALVSSLNEEYGRLVEMLFGGGDGRQSESLILQRGQLFFFRLMPVAGILPKGKI